MSLDAAGGDDLARYGFREGFAVTPRHSSRYLEAGAKDGPAIVLVHGWPEIARTWRHQLRTLGGLGFRVIAPDLRGCGGSSLYAHHEAYRQSELVADMIELVDCLGVDTAVWVGHDWGSAVVWNVATHHRNRCRAVASLAVGYRTLERGLPALEALVNRRQYPEDQYPAAQFDYIHYYHEDFAAATGTFEADLGATFAAVMRRPDPAQAGQPFLTAFVRRHGGWFGGQGRAPAVPRDDAVLEANDHAALVSAYRRTGFFGANALYMNDASNLAYADAAPDGPTLALPVLFLSGLYDFVSDNERSELMRPMMDTCTDLVTRTIPCGHWIQQESPRAVNAALAEWIVRRVPDAWPTSAG